jgi:hypothetical protein
VHGVPAEESTRIADERSTARNRATIRSKFQAIQRLEKTGSLNKLDGSNIESLASQVETLHRLAREVFENSDEFPAVNRNAKRLLASIATMQLNLETGSD